MEKNSGSYLVSQDRASHKLPDLQELTRSGAVPAQVTASDTVTSVLCFAMAGEMLLDPNQAALGGQSCGGLVLYLGDQFTDHSDVITPTSQFIAWKEDYLREGNCWSTNILMTAF